MAIADNPLEAQRHASTMSMAMLVDGGHPSVLDERGIELIARHYELPQSW